MALERSHFEELTEAVLSRWLDRLEEAPGVDEAELVDGVLTVTMENGRIFVLNRHGASRQIWLSSPVSGAHHYAYEPSSGAWRQTRQGLPLEAQLTADFATFGIALDD